MSSCPKVFLIDTHGLCYRAFYAVRGLSNSKGQPTNAVLGFCNILRKLISDLKPKYIAACFDAGKKTHRQEKFAGYKIKRQAMPDDLASQIQIIRDLLSAYQIPIFEVDGFEADDIMATLTRTYIAQGLDVVLVTDDKDMAQLVGEHVQVYSARNAALLDAQGIAAKFGVRPDQIVDYLALAGDATDNIPGVPGIGEVGAKKLLAEFGSLAKIYKNLDKVGP